MKIRITSADTMLALAFSEMETAKTEAENGEILHAYYTMGVAACHADYLYNTYGIDISKIEMWDTLINEIKNFIDYYTQDIP